MSEFMTIQVKKPTFTLLPLGENVVFLSRVEETNSFQQYNGLAKDELPDWKDSGPQLAATFTAGESGKVGAVTHRFQKYGYVRHDELSEKQLKSGKYENIGGYACTKDKQGDMVRVIDEERTKACENILMQLAASLQIPPATEENPSNFGDGVAKAIAEKTLLRITVINDPFEGRDQFRVTKMKAIANITVNEDFEE